MASLNVQIPLPPDDFNGAEILVAGINGSGKSSLINKLAQNDNLATVGGTVHPTQHKEPAMKLKHQFPPGLAVTFYDTQGFGDLAKGNQKIAEAVVKKMKTANIVLICHKLYSRVDDPVAAMLKELVIILGNELMKHAIFVFTFGDEYIINCRPKPVSDLPNDEVKRQMEKQANDISTMLQNILKFNGIEENVAENIPFCIASADEDVLPTCRAGFVEGGWVHDFWEVCKLRFTHNALPFVSWTRRNKAKSAAITGSAFGSIGGVGLGMTIGAFIGTGVIPIPGVGTIAGAVVGAVVGIGTAVAGGLLGGAASGGVTKVAISTHEKYVDKKIQNIPHQAPTN